jgi:acetoin utilization deacetylase AcuC-like enzyme
MDIWYTDHFVLPLPAGHRFPMAKYAELRRRIALSPWLPAGALREPPALDDAVLALAHSREYLNRVAEGRLTAAEQRRIGFPWSAAMVERSRRAAGATYMACRSALTDGVGVNLAGGTHHAYADHGEGFCVFNDSAVAGRALQAEGRVRRIAVIDCDVHQGNGTAAILAGDDSIFTCSLHGAGNWPLDKEHSDLDVALPDGTGDDDYLSALALALDETFRRARPELVIYLSGADPWVGDRLGKLALSKAGLQARDRRVYEACRAYDVPVAVTMGGGYAPDFHDSVDIHYETVRLAWDCLGR